MNQDIIEKLKKILACGDLSRGCTQAEAEVAMAKAQALAIEHNIDLSNIDNTERKKAGIETDRANITVKPGVTAHKYVGHILKVCFDVEFISINGGHGYAVVGEKVDTAIAVFCFPWLTATFMKLWREERKRGVLTDRLSYFIGLREGIIANNLRVKKQAPTSSAYALVLVDKEAAVKARTALEFPRIVVKPGRAHNTQLSAFQAGRDAGSKIKLTHQIA
jgi:hypothetical protein